MKITGIRTHIVMPIDTLAWVFVEVDTDEGLERSGGHQAVGDRYRSEAYRRNLAAPIPVSMGVGISPI